MKHLTAILFVSLFCICLLIGCRGNSVVSAGIGDHASDDPTMTSPLLHYSISPPDTVPNCTIFQEPGRTFLRIIDGPPDSMAAWRSIDPETLVRDALGRNIQVGDIWYPMGTNRCTSAISVTAIIVSLNVPDTTMERLGFVGIGDYDPYCTQPSNFRHYHFTWK